MFFKKKKTRNQSVFSVFFLFFLFFKIKKQFQNTINKPYVFIAFLSFLLAKIMLKKIVYDVFSKNWLCLIVIIANTFYLKNICKEVICL